MVDRVEFECPCGFVFVARDEQGLLALARRHVGCVMCDPRRDPPFDGLNDDEAIQEIRGRATPLPAGQSRWDVASTSSPWRLAATGASSSGPTNLRPRLH